MGKKSSDAPPAPNYAAQAQAQAQANIEATRLANIMNNPNVINPLGTRTVTWGSGEFDQAGYDRALADYNNNAGYSSNGRSYEVPNHFTDAQLNSMFDDYATQYGGNFSQSTADVDLPQDFLNTTVWQDGGWDGNGGTRSWSPNNTSGGSYGSSSGAPNRSDFYAGGGNADQATIVETLSPTQQALFDSENRIKQDLLDIGESGLGRVEESFNAPFDMGAVHEIGTQPGLAGRDAYVQALIAREAPFMEDSRRQKENQLLLQGHNRGGKAWNSSQDDINRRENDFNLAAILAGGQEQSRLYGMERDKRSNDIQEQSFLRNLPLNEVNALRSGNQAMMPQFQAFQGQGVAPAPIFDAASQQYGAQLNNYNAQQSRNSNLIGGLFGLGGSILGAPGVASGLFGL